MALKHRHIPVDFLPNSGLIFIESANAGDVLRETTLLNKRHNNLHIYKNGLKEFMQNNNFSGFSLSNSELLYNLHKNLFQFVAHNNITENDVHSQTKTIENELAQKAIENIEKIYDTICKQEFPDAKHTKPDANEKTMFPLIRENFKKIPTENLQNLDLVQQIIQPAYMLCMYIEKNFPTYNNRRIKDIAEICQNLFAKVNGREVIQKKQTPHDTLAALTPRIERLIAQDNPGAKPIDRINAASNLAVELDKLGMELHVIYINKRTPYEEMLHNAKTLILRADWDGFIARPNSQNCSSAFKSVLYKNVIPIDKSKYNLKNSDVYNLCMQMESFHNFKKNGKVYSLEQILTDGLSRMGFPPHRINELNYTDIAFLINEKMGANAEDVNKFKAKGLSAIDAVQINSARKEYIKNFVAEHEEELRQILLADKTDSLQIEEIINTLKEGSLPKYWSGHHLFNLNQNDEYEKATGLPWYTMNKKAVVIVDQTSHYFIHMIENYISAKGKVSKAKFDDDIKGVIACDSTNSHRTVFIDNASGQQYFYTVMPKQYYNHHKNNEKVLNVVALFENSSCIFTKEFVDAIRQTKEKSLNSNTNTTDIQAQTQHIKERAKEIEEQKQPNEQNQHKTIKKVQIRPNYRGLEAFGAHKKRLSDRRNS